MHRYRRGHGFDSRSGLNFFQALFLNCLSWVYTAMIFICLKNYSSYFKSLQKQTLISSYKLHKSVQEE